MEQVQLYEKIQIKFQKEDLDILNKYKDNLSKIRSKIDSQDINFYIDYIVNSLFEANKYFNDQEPWKKKDDLLRLNTIVYTALEIVRKISFLLYPIIPASSLKALKIFDIKDIPKISLLECELETGRTHQIRVHLQDRHTPIYGDDVYGISDWNKRLVKAHGIQRPLLHAHRLEIGHPMTGEHMVFVAPMAEDMISIAKGIWPDGIMAFPEQYMEV